MTKKTSFFIIQIMALFLLSACSGGEESTEDNNPVPKELIENKDPLKIKDQLGLAIGENGWIIDWANSNTLEITLNSAKVTSEIDGQTPEGHNSEDDVYVIGNFTIKNHGDIGIPGQGVAYPDLVAGAEKDKIENDGFEGPQDLLGRGDTATVIENALNKQGPTDPGEERTGNVILVAEHKVDKYIIYFGYEDYDNKLTWEFDATEIQ